MNFRITRLSRAADSMILVHREMSLRLWQVILRYAPSCHDINPMPPMQHQDIFWLRLPGTDQGKVRFR